MTTNHCGTCTACCRVYAIPQLDPPKPAGKWCQHCAIGKGCKIYADRPQPCVDFKCLWLLSREQSDVSVHLADALRPDRCKVVFAPTTNPNVMAATLMPGAPDAHRRKPVADLIDRMVKGGLGVAVGMPASLTQTVITPLGEKTVTMTAPDADGMQWRIMKDGEEE